MSGILSFIGVKRFSEIHQGDYNEELGDFWQIECKRSAETNIQMGKGRPSAWRAEFDTLVSALGLGHATVCLTAM
jgi:hypothetical protein